MSLSIFGDKAVMPDDRMLAEVLTGGTVLWDAVKNHVATTCGDVSEQWKYYSGKAGWTLVLKSGKRTILYLIPLEGCFKVNFVFGEKAVAAARDAGLPDPVIAFIMATAQYAEGRPFMFDVETEADVDAVKKLVEIKHIN